MVQRQLAAVLAADICEYSRLMGEDSEAMIRALRRLRAEVFGPAVASRRGRVVKNMGDGWIVLFGTASDAVSAAIVVQDNLARSKRSDEPHILLRIGVHLGELFEENDDVFGDCVNIAARLEASAAPGTIAISEAAYGGVDGTLRPSFDSVGAWDMKNIDWPVHVWVREAPTPDTDLVNSSAHLNLVVQPVVAIDQRPEMRALADAVTGDLSEYLSVTLWLHTTTSRQADDADYTLESRLRSNGNQVRLEARLLDASGRPHFSKKFDGNLDHAFDWQDRVGEDLAGQTIAAIFASEKSKLQALDVDDMNANECLLRSQLEGHNLDPESVGRSLDFARKALEKNPRSPDAMAQFMLMLAVLDEIPQEYLSELEHWLKAAEPYKADHSFLNGIATWLGEWVRFGDREDFREKLRLNRKNFVESCLRRSPRDFVMLLWCGWTFLFLGEPRKAFDCLRQSQKLGRHTPWNTSIENGLSMVHLQEGRYEKAIEHARALLAASPGYPPPLRILASALAQSGQIEEAQQVLGQLLSLDPDASIRKFQMHTPYDITPETLRYLDGLRIAGMPE